VPTSETTKPIADPTRPVAVSRYILFFSLAIFGCLVDLWSKAAVFSALGMPGTGQRYWLIAPFFGFETSLNEGALFGIGQGYTSVFAFFSVVAAVGIYFWLFIKRAANDLLLTIALGMITGGIFGNLYDRLGLWGQAAVRDFILIQYSPQYVWPNFNIADSLLVCGAGLMLWHAIFMADKPAQNTPE